MSKNKISKETDNTETTNDKGVTSTDLLYDSLADKLLDEPFTCFERLICYSFLGFTCLAMMLGFSLILITILTER